MNGEFGDQKLGFAFADEYNFPYKSLEWINSFTDTTEEKHVRLVGGDVDDIDECFPTVICSNKMPQEVWARELAQSDDPDGMLATFHSRFQVVVLKQPMDFFGAFSDDGPQREAELEVQLRKTQLNDVLDA